MEPRRRRVWLAQQQVWDVSGARESMPLACGYLKAVVEGDPALHPELECRIFNFQGSDSSLAMVRRMLFDQLPDVLALSVFGWSYQRFGEVAQTFKQLNPEGWVVLGGTHVTNQGERCFRMFPSVDVVANGEGERTFRELLRAYLEGRSPRELGDIEGISFRDPDGKVTTTAERPRIDTLDEIPSPFLSGAIPLSDERGDFPYDCALVETNRGCPYKCAFCFWGGAVGQKLRAFSLERLREEVELFARLRVTNVVLCDANFGMTEQDEQFMEVLIRAREQHGYPRHLETSWAKNKGKRFYDIVRSMKNAGFQSSFTLALQTLDAATLADMGRKNMKLNDWRDLASWLRQEGFDLYAELIWGAPGETYDTFLAGYDLLAEHVSRIATYPHLILPNTDYSEKRDQFGFVTWRDIHDDFEYVLAHRTMSIADNQRMHRFLFWARTCAEHMVFRNVWRPLRKLAGISQSQVLLSLDRWIDEQPEPAAAALVRCRAEVVDHLNANRIDSGLQTFYARDDLGALLERWFKSEMLPQVSAELRDCLLEVFRYDWVTRPILHTHKAELPPGTRQVEVAGEGYYVRDRITTLYDVPDIVGRLSRGEEPALRPHPSTVSLYYKVGFESFIRNHEFYPQFVGKTLAQLEAEQGKRMEPVVAMESVH